MSNDYQAEATAADEREYLASAMAPAEVDLGPGPKSAIAIRLSGTDVERLKARADEEGVGFTQLARQWILERLDEPSELPAGAEAAFATLRSYISRGYVAEATEGKTRVKATKATKVSKAGTDRLALSKATGATGPVAPAPARIPTRH